MNNQKIQYRQYQYPLGETNTNRLLKTKSDFNYYDFFAAKTNQQLNQCDYFKEFLKSKITEEIPYKILQLKSQLKKIDWGFLVKSCQLTTEFILMQLDYNWCKDNAIISGSIETEKNFITINILNFLDPIQLCKNYNLTQKINDDTEKTLLEAIIEIIHNDRIKYSISDRLYSSISDESDVGIFDSSYNHNIQNVIFDDFIQYYQSSSFFTPTENSFYYMSRISDTYGLNYRIDINNEYSSEYSGYESTLPTPILKFHTTDKQFLENYTNISYEYQINQKQEQVVTTIKTSNTPYIADKIRYVGIDKKTLIENQIDLPNNFLCRYYNIDEISKYHGLLYDKNDNNENIIINTPSIFSLSDSSYTSIESNYNFDQLFENNYFNFNDPQIISFLKNQENILSDKAKKDICLYQKITDDFGNILPIVSSLNFINDSSYSNLINTASLQENEGKFIKTINFKPLYSQSGIIDDLVIINDKDIRLTNYANIKYTSNTVDTLPIILNTDSSSESYYGKFSDNIIVTNLSNITKQNLLLAIKQRTKINGNNFYLYGNSSNENNEPILKIVEDSIENNSYLNLCIRLNITKFDILDNSYQFKTFQDDYIDKLDFSLTNNVNIFDSNNDEYYQLLPNKLLLDKKYFICGTSFNLHSYYSALNYLPVKVYLKDIIAILDTGTIAASKVWINKNKIKEPIYQVIETQSGYTLTIKK